MKVYSIQAKVAGQWLTCYRFNRLEAAQEQLTRMNQEYDREHRIKESV